MTVAIRTATLADVDALGSVHVRSWQETYRGLLPDALIASYTTASRAALWRRVIEAAPAGESRAVLAERDGAIIGFGALAPQRDAALAEQGYVHEITALYLLREHQGQGIGRALVTALARWAGEHGGGLALLVLAGNDQASGFYTRLGWQVVARKTDTRGAAVLEELAYGWPDTNALIQQDHP